MRSALGLRPFVMNTMQSTRCAHPGTSTALNFCKSPGCRQGFLATSTSAYVVLRDIPVPWSVIRTKHSPSFNFPGRLFLLEGSHTPNKRRDCGMKILHRCSLYLFNILAYSALTRPWSADQTVSMPSRSNSPARSNRSQKERKWNAALGSPWLTLRIISR